MALDFSGVATVKQVDFGAGASITGLSAFTTITWVYRTAAWQNDNGQISEKGNWPASRCLDMNIGNGEILAGIVDRATTDAEYLTSTTVDLNTWNYLAHTFEGTDGPRAFKGTLAAIAVECAYTTRTVGEGARGSDSGLSLRVGGRTAGGATANFQGRIAVFMVYNSQLTLAQIQAQQSITRPIFSGCVLFNHLGFNGTGTQPDWSGNGNNGTVTGATVADHAPIAPPFTGLGGWRGAFTAAGAPPAAVVLPPGSRTLLGVGI